VRSGNAVASEDSPRTCSAPRRRHPSWSCFLLAWFSIANDCLRRVCSLPKVALVLVLIAVVLVMRLVCCLFASASTQGVCTREQRIVNLFLILNSSVDYLPISIAKKEMTASCVLCLCVDLVVCGCEIALLLLFSALSEVIRGRVAAAVIIGWCTDSCVVVLWRNVKCLLGEREKESELRIVRRVEREYEGLLLDGESFCTGFLVLIFVFGDGFQRFAVGGYGEEMAVCKWLEIKE